MMMMFMTSQPFMPKPPGIEHYYAFSLPRLAPSTYFLKIYSAWGSMIEKHPARAFTRDTEVDKS